MRPLMRKRAYPRAQADTPSCESAGVQESKQQVDKEHLFFRLSGRLYRSYPSVAIERRARCSLLRALVATDRIRHSNGLACYWSWFHAPETQQ